MKNTFVVLIVLLVPSSCFGNFCAFDSAPAATLLFPFVALSYDQGNDLNTVLSVTNLSTRAQIVRATFWSDLGQPVLSFNIVLTGFDMQTIDVREVLTTGALPVTVVGGHTTFEGVRSEGPVSELSDLNGEWLTDFLDQPESTNQLTIGDRCTAESDGYPGTYSDPLPEAALSAIQAMLQLSSHAALRYSDSCDYPFEDGAEPFEFIEPWFTNRLANETWLYVTVDVVRSCNAVSPSDASYWGVSSDDSTVDYSNVLIGQVVWESSSGAAGGNAVHLEADRQHSSVVAKTPESKPVSFYHQRSTLLGLNSDAREPLPTSWALRIREPRNPDNPARFRVWKGGTSSLSSDLARLPSLDEPSELVASNCYAYTYYAWDEEENVSTYYVGPDWFQYPDNGNMLPLVTQEVSVDQFNLPAETGWVLFVWPFSNYPFEADASPDQFQVWMGVIDDAWGPFSTFTPGVSVANSNCFPDQRLPDLGVDYDYVDFNGYRGGRALQELQTPHVQQ